LGVGGADQDPARVGRIETDRTVRDQRHRLHQQFVLTRILAIPSHPW